MNEAHGDRVHHVEGGFGYNLLSLWVDLGSGFRFVTEVSASLLTFNNMEVVTYL